MIDTARRLKYLSFGLLTLGWLVSGYLLLRMVTIGTARLRWKPGISAGSLCSGCDEALSNASAWTPGVPLPGIGLVYFAILGFLIALGTPWATRLAFLLCAAGAGIGVILSATLFSSGDACYLCFLIHAANLVLVVMLWLQVSRQPRRDAEPAWLFSSKAWAPIALVIMLTSGLLMTAMAHPSADTGKILAQYRSAPVFELPAEPADAVLGPPDGRVRLVVFSSFQCAWCQRFAPSVRYLNEHYGDKLTIVFKNFPLSKACNPSLPSDPQPQACAAAWAAEAANLQKAFWPFHDGLFSESLTDNEDFLRATARGAGLNLARWDKDRQSPEVHLKIMKDVLLGQRLRIAGTPTVYLDGRRIKNPSIPVLEILIKEEIAGSM